MDGLREKLQETGNPHILMGKLMVSCRCSLKPIHWLLQKVELHHSCFVFLLRRGFFSYATADNTWCLGSTLGMNRTAIIWFKSWFVDVYDGSNHGLWMFTIEYMGIHGFIVQIYTVYGCIWCIIIFHIYVMAMKGLIPYFCTNPFCSHTVHITGLSSKKGT